MTRARRQRWLPVSLAALAGCSAVAVPEEHTYRLLLTAAADGAAVDAPDPRVVRVAPLALAAHLSPDQVMRAEDDVRLVGLPLERWTGRLDEMVTDALIQRLRRARVFAQVKGVHDGGGQDLWLTGTVREFWFAAAGDGPVPRAVARLEMHLRDSDDVLLLGGEFAAEVPLPSAAPADAVRGLSAATAASLDQLVRAIGERGEVHAPAAGPR